MRKLFGIVGAVIATLLGLVVLVAGVAVTLLQSGALNGVIEEAIAAEAGQPARLEQAPSLGYEDGALTLRLGPLSVANAPWAAQQHPDLAGIQEIRASLRLLPLLRGRVELPEVVIDSPQIHLARAEDGEVNWPEDEEDGPPPQVPRIENLVIRDALVTYTDALAAIDAELVLDEATGRLGGGQDTALDATGRLQDAPLELSARAGPLVELLDEGGMSAPATVEATIGGSRIAAQAMAFADLEQLEAEVEIDGEPTLTAILAGLGLGEADLPPFRARATVEPGAEGSQVVADVEIEGASLHLDGNVADPAAPLDRFAAAFTLDAPEFGALLARFEVPYADQVPSAEIDGDITHDDGGTTFALQGSAGGDVVEVEGGYSGEITALENLRADVLLEGSALGALPAQLGFATRPIESYRIAAGIEERVDRPSPVRLDVTIEDTRLQFDGGIDDLRALEGVEGRFQAQGPDPAAVLDLFELPSISLPRYDVAGQVTWRSDELEVRDLGGKVGDSDISGDATIDPRPEPPTVTANLHSDILHLKDLRSVIGLPPAPGEDEGEEGRLLPDKEVDPALWRRADLDVEYSANRIESDYLPVDRIEVQVTSTEGWLTVDPLVTGLAEGTIIGFASLDATRAPVASELDIRMDALQLQEMLAKLGIEGEGFGEIDGRIRLLGQGTSVGDLLGSADGQVVLTMGGGALDALIVQLIGLDVAGSIGVILESMVSTEEVKTPIRCAIINLELEQGVATTNPLVVDTVASKIIVDGQINLRDETLDVFIEALPKDASPLSGNQPLRVEGPLRSPSVHPAPGRTESEPLGWLLAPLAAVLPFFDIGGEEDSPCGALIAEAREAAAAPPQ